MFNQRFSTALLFSNIFLNISQRMTCEFWRRILEHVSVVDLNFSQIVIITSYYRVLLMNTFIHYKANCTIHVSIPTIHFLSLYIAYLLTINMESKTLNSFQALE